MKQYSLVASGGTFDHFHKGHSAFLRLQFSISEKVVIGLSSDAFLATYKSTSTIEPYSVRLQNLTAFLKKEGVAERVTITEIHSLYIPPSLEKLPIEAIVVTKDSKKGAQLINKKREEEGKGLLAIIEVPTVAAEDLQPISSTRIRSGEISRDGKQFIKSEWLEKTLILPDTLRTTLGKPFDVLIPDFETWYSSQDLDKETVITVGDTITLWFGKKHFGQKISVIDLQVKRKRLEQGIKTHNFTRDEHFVHVVNPPGCITPMLFAAVKDMFFASKVQERFVLQVDGEEDLAVLPIILAAPLGFTLFYGQPDEGVVKVEINEENKEKTYAIVEQFHAKEGKVY